MFIVLFIGIAVISIATTVIIGLIMAPLRAITTAAERVNSGDYGVRVEVGSNDEIGMLAKMFNSAVEHFRGWKERLEKEVNNRTLELQAANQQLRASEQQLKASNQQLVANEQQLKASNQQLRAIEQQLRIEMEVSEKAESNFKLLFEEMLSGFAQHEIICDANGKPVDYRFLAVNPAFERMTGLKARDILGKSVREVIPGIEDYWIDIYGKVAMTGVPVAFENYIKSLNKYFSVAAFKTSTRQFACMFVDITDRKTAEQALMQNQQLLMQAEKMTGIGQLSTQLSHDLSSPLMGLSTLIESYHKKAKPGSDDEFETAKMLETVVYLKEIVRNLNSFARNEVERKVEPLDVTKLMESTLIFASPLLTGKNITLVRRYDQGIPAVKGDRIHLQQVVMNILSNAKDATPPGGRVTIGVKSAPDKRRVLIEVEDTGAGIAKDSIAKIFDPFFTTKKVGEGIGLGLVIVQKIIKEHGGSISVESELGRGTKICIMLPASEEKGG